MRRKSREKEAVLMIIDLHTHVFPDKIAERTIGALAVKSGKPAADGTVADLRRSMRESGVDVAVNLPAITKASQFDSTNRFAAEINGHDGIYSFGAIHPDCEDPEAKLDYIKSLGLRGIKIHPDYQQCFIDDERYIWIIRYAVEIGLYVTTHAGFDNGFPELTHCTPDRSARMLDAVYGKSEPAEPRIIFAHLGGRGFYDGVESLLCGRNVYFDLSYVLIENDPALTTRIVRAHGAERVVFGSDSPWRSQKDDLAREQMLGLSAAEHELILEKNGRAILGI